MSNARRVYSAAVDKAIGVVCDQSVRLKGLKGLKSAKDYPEHLRRVRFKDPATGKTLVFLTNNTALPAPVIAQLYKNRWQAWWSNKKRQNDRVLSNLNGKTSEQQNIPKIV